MADVLDRYYLAITLLITVAYQLSGFAIAWLLQFDKITDFTGGSNFFLLALITLTVGNTYNTRNIVASVFVMVWATRLAGFLLFRVLKTGSDNRFDSIRSNFFKFLGFWVGQILWVWTVSLPVIILNSPAVSGSRLGANPSFGTGRDIAGIVLWAVGWLIETIADAQKYHFKSSGKEVKGRPMSYGLWAWSRHPPYFGEMLVWWGIWAICISPAASNSISSSSRAALYGSVVSPLLTMIILMFGSGLPTAEKPTASKFYLMSFGPNSSDETADAWPRYKRFLQRTSILVPIPPVIYKPLPGFVKRTLLFDFPLYRFDEKTDGGEALQEEEQNQA